MLDAELRKSLSQEVRRLVTGRMTNDDFDDVYYRSYISAGDRAISEIALSCYCLYNSDLMFPYRLRGSYAVDEGTRVAVARSVLFLRSGLEYEWPSFPDSPTLRVLAGFAMMYGLPAGIAFSLIGIPFFAMSEFHDGTTGTLAVLGPLLLIGSVALAFFWPRMMSDKWRAFRGAGDFDVWPFLRRGDYDRARETCHMFAK